jgi:hypothetical protein
MASYWIKFTVIFIVAAALLLTGFAIAWYPNYRRDILKLTLEQNSLTQAERDNLESSLSWWSNQGVLMYGTIADFVLLGDILVFVYAAFYILTSVWRESIKARAGEKSPK